MVYDYDTTMCNVPRVMIHWTCWKDKDAFIHSFIVKLFKHQLLESHLLYCLLLSSLHSRAVSYWQQQKEIHSTCLLHPSPQYLVEATVSWINLPAYQYWHVSPEVGQEAWHAACKINNYPSGNNALHVECMQCVD